MLLPYCCHTAAIDERTSVIYAGTSTFHWVRGGHMARTVTAHERFRGLTSVQICALIEIDERARCITEVERIADIVAQYADAGIPFTADRALHYAREAEATGEHGVAYPWYSWWMTYKVREDAELARRKAKIKAYFIRHGFLWGIREWRFHCSTEEWLSVANAALAKQRVFGKGAGAESAREVLDVFVRIGDRRCIRAFLARALQHVNEDDAIAVAAARALGRTLTIRERERIARRILRFDTNLADAFLYIRKHRLHSLYRPLIDAAVSNEWVGYETIRRWAIALRTPLRIRDLERCFTTFRYRTTTGTGNAVAIAEALARRSKRWCAKLPEIYAWARNRALGWNEPELAEKYGRRCGKPLTPEELLAIAQRLEGRARDGLDWAVAHRKFCFHLAAERIATVVGAPPDRLSTHAAAAA